MLRKKEKKSIASIIALLIGWPVGLDQFLDGNKRNGVMTTVGWLVTFFLFLLGASGQSGAGPLLFSFIGAAVGTVCIFKKLVSQLKAFVEADD